MPKESSIHTGPLWILTLTIAGYLALEGCGAALGLIVGGILAIIASYRDRASGSRLDELEQRIVALEQRVKPETAQEKEPETPGTPAPPLEPAPAPALDLSTAHLTADRSPQPGPVTTPARLPAPPAGAPPLGGSGPTGSEPGPEPFTDSIRRIISFFAGGNPVVRVGMLVLFFGVAFLARYAAERGLVSIELRLAAIAAGAVIVFLTGWRLRERPGAYGLVLQGGGIGALYITVFTAARLYEMVPLFLAFGVMVALVLFSGILALLQDSRWLALFGITGGFLAPVLTSTGEGSHITLFVYFALLNLGILGIAWFRAWRELNLAGFLFTFVLGTYWGIRYYRPEHFSTTEPFLVLFFLFYVAIAVLFAFRQPSRLGGYVDATLVFGVPITAFALQAPMVDPFEYGLAWSALAMSFIYIALATILWRRAGEALRLLSEAFLALGLIFATVAVPLAFDGHWTAAVWALEGAALFWVGIRQRRLLPRVSGVVLQFVAGIAFVDPALSGASEHPFLNSRWLGAVMIALAALFTSWYLRRRSEVVRQKERPLEVPLLLWGLGWWTISGLIQIERHIRLGEQTHAIALFFAFSAIVTAWLSVRLDWYRFSLYAAILAPSLVWLFLYELAAIRYEHALQGWGVLTWPFALLSTLLVTRMTRGLWRAGHTSLWQALTLWLLTGLLAWELARVVDARLEAGPTWSLISWGFVPSLVILALLRWGPRLRWPIDPERFSWLKTVLVGLGSYLMIWLFLTGFESGDPSPLSYLPIMSPLDLAQLFALLTAIRWLARWRRREPDAVPLATFWSVSAILGFYWLNVVMTRAVHFYGEVPWNTSSLGTSIVWQSSASLLWTATALVMMVIAARNSWRTLWFAGAGLLSVVVAKLFVVDLAGTGTLARIISFLGVGALMLIIGFFSPLPPRTNGVEEAQST